MQNILITGGSSYLGSKTIDYFKDFTFYGLEHNSKLLERKNLFTFQDTNFKEIISKYKIDIIIHFATNSDRTNKQNKEEIHKTNVLLGEELLNACIDSKVKLFISAGSYSQDIFERPPNFYVETKNIFEASLISYSKKHRLRILNYLLGDVYGKDDFRSNKLINYLIQNEDKEQIKFNSNGLGAFSPVYINDILSIMEEDLNLAHDEKFYRRKIISSNIITVKEFVKIYKMTRGKKFKEIYNNIENPYSNFKKINSKDLLFKTSIEEGLKSLEI